MSQQQQQQQPCWQTIPKQLGYPHPVGQGALYPGAERERLLSYLLARLLYPASLESVLGKLMVSPTAGSSIEECSTEEQLSQKFAMLLSTVGIPTTADLVRGNVEHETNVSFLENLANIVLMQRQVEQSVTDPQQPATSLAGEAKTLEFACDKFLAITSEAATLFPSDITKMLHQYSPDADSMLAYCQQHTQDLAQGAERLQQEIDGLTHRTLSDDKKCRLVMSPLFNDKDLVTCALSCTLQTSTRKQVTLSSPGEWTELCSAVQQALEDFISDIQDFLDIYDKELHVWCEHLEAPVTHGFGQQAAAMLEAYNRLWRVLNSMACVKQIHTAMTRSQPPLQVYQPEELQQVARAGQQEVAKLIQEMDVLARAAQRKRSFQEKKPWAILTS